MKHLFLTSAIGTPGVAESIRAKLNHNRPLKTTFITTPIEVEDMTDNSWYQDDRKALIKNGFDIFDYTITGKKSSDFVKDLGSADAIYVSGGNTNHLLEQSQKSGFIDFIRDFVNSGKLYLGTSAGSIIAGPTLPPYLWGDEVGAPNLLDYNAYNLVNFTLLPHWGSDIFKDKYLGGRMSQIYSESMQPFILLNDHQYVEVLGRLVQGCRHEERKMKLLFLTSQVQYVAHDIAKKLGQAVGLPAVFITTALHDKVRSNLSWHETNRAKLKKTGFSFVDYDIVGKSEAQIKNDLDKYTIMYVEGGNSFYLLQESQKNNFGQYVKERVGQGMIYISTSAGSVIAGPDIEPVSRTEQTILAPDLKGTIGYGLVDFVVMPHWGSEEKRQFYENFRIKGIYNEDYPYILLTDHQYVEVTDDWYKIIDVTKN